MKSTRCAVIGVGYLGRFHAQKYAQLPNAELVGVCDVNTAAAETVARELNTTAYTDVADLFGKVDAVSIAASTLKHYELAKRCLEQGIHVLLEKPITETLAQADELIALARQHQVTLQVGHLERFNSARMALEPFLDKPLFIEAERIAPFNPRGADVNVVLDLMIHDIDLILDIVKSPLVRIDAQGAPVITKAIDIANARLTFANHCVANITASRISAKAARTMRIYQAQNYVSLDFQNKHLALFTKGVDELAPGIPNIVQENHQCENKDALLEEIKSFLLAIQTNTRPLVSGDEGRNALETAQRITSLIESNWAERHATI